MHVATLGKAAVAALASLAFAASNGVIDVIDTVILPN